MGKAHRINADEREQIVALLKRLPLPAVRDKTGRCYATLAKIAEVAL